MNIRVKHKYPNQILEYTIPEFFEYALEDISETDSAPNTARNVAKAMGRLCDNMADRLQLSAQDLVDICGCSAEIENPEFC